MQRPKEIALALLAGALITGGALGFAAGHLLDARADARKQIMGILSPDQQKRFQEILQEHDRAAEANRK
jgi:hypothetical protein